MPYHLDAPDFYFLGVTHANFYQSNIYISQQFKKVKMSQWKLPSIESKKQINEEDDYNFVGKDKKKTKDSALNVVEELKRKIEEQKRQIQNRNATIMGLQRNFQSLSGIVKHQKAQNAALKAQLQNYKQNSENGDKRATQFHQKCVILQNQNKTLKQDLNSLRKQHSDCNKYVIQCETFKNQLLESEKTTETLSSKLDHVNQQKKLLEIQINRLKSEEKNKRVLNERIVDLEDELKKYIDQVNIFSDKNKLLDDELRMNKNQKNSLNQKINELQTKIKQLERTKKNLQLQNEQLSRQVKKAQNEKNQLISSLESKDVFSKMKTQQEQSLKEQLKKNKLKNDQLVQEISELKQTITEIERQSDKKSQLIKIQEKQIRMVRQELEKEKEKFKKKQQTYLKETTKLTKWVQELNSKLDESQGKYRQLNTKLIEESELNLNYNQKMKLIEGELKQVDDKMKNQQRKYAKYYKEIDENQPNVLITNRLELTNMKQNNSEMIKKLELKTRELSETNQILLNDNENMKKYITSLQKQINEKTRKNNENEKKIRQLEDALEKMENQELKMKKMIQEERTNTKMLEKITTEERIKSQKEIEEQRSRSQSEREKYQKMLMKYKSEQSQLRELMNREQEEMSTLAKVKQQQIAEMIKIKEQELEKQRKNNKLLWSDNKKLKQMQEKMKEQAEIQLKQIEDKKKAQIERLRRQFQDKYKQQLGDNLQSNSNELKKILKDKAEQVKMMTENYNKLKSQLQFYKNRNKQLEGVVSRTEKSFKDQLATLEKELKTSKEVVSVLDKKTSEINLAKQEIEKKMKDQISKLKLQIQSLKLKYEDQKIQEKIILLNQSILEFQTSLKTLSNTLSCNYCVEMVKECVRVKECGHIYCRKCKAGYQPNCGQCKKGGTVLPDKMMDDTVSKTGYMKILLATIKDDLNKISL